MKKDRISSTDLKVKLTQGQEPSRQHNTNDVYKKIIEILFHNNISKRPKINDLDVNTYVVLSNYFTYIFVLSIKICKDQLFLLFDDWHYVARNSARLLKGHRFKDTAVDLGLEISGR